MPYFDDIQPVSHLDGFLADLDYLVSVLPDTAATTGLLDARALSLLPQRCYFINVGRGNVVDDTALVDALHAGRLSGATLDVFDEEPLPSDSLLWSTPNFVVTPHVSADDGDSYVPITLELFFDNFRRYLGGEPLRNVVRPELGY